MKAKIICILVMTLLITTTLSVVGKTTDNNGLFSSGQKEPNSPNLLKPIPSLAGQRVAVIDAGEYYPSEVVAQLNAYGAIATLISIPAINFNALQYYNNIWIPVGGADEIDHAGKAPIILQLVDDGVGLIFCQPDIAPYIPACLPYIWEITDYYWANDPCATTIVDPTHDLTTGLTIADMPDCYDTVGTVAPQYTILALNSDGEPSLACATYGKGKIVVTMDAPLGPWEDICYDNPPLSQAMISRILDWSKRSKSVDIPIVETINRPFLNWLQSHPNLFPLLQKLLQGFGL